MDPDDSALAVDRMGVSTVRALEGTRVRVEGDRITAIGKNLTPFDALDTGVFVFSSRIFPALERSRLSGDTSLSGGVRLLAQQRHMRAVETDGSEWCDIDTPGDLEVAEDVIRRTERTR
jgi:choline kinase